MFGGLYVVSALHGSPNNIRYMVPMCPMRYCMSVLSPTFDIRCAVESDRRTISGKVISDWIYQ